MKKPDPSRNVSGYKHSLLKRQSFFQKILSINWYFGPRRKKLFSQAYSGQESVASRHLLVAVGF